MVICAAFLEWLKSGSATVSGELLVLMETVAIYARAALAPHLTREADTLMEFLTGILLAPLARGARRIPVKNSINVSASRVKWGASAARAYIATVSISTSNSPETVAEPDFNHSRKAAQMTMAVKAADAHKA